jgi:hypothetical protein
MTSQGLEIAIKQIEFARKNLLLLIADIADEDWFYMPQGITHVAWQVAHLAMAQYGLCLFRVRGRSTEDIHLMPSDFRKKFSRGSTPIADPAENPTPVQIRDVLNRVYEQSMKELSTYTDEQLNAPVDEPHAVFATKLGAIFFCSSHEVLHCGQIGLIRRLIGKKPIR